MGVKKIKAFPNQNIDYIWVKNGTASQALIDSTLVAGFIPTFDNGTLMLANYNDNSLDAGNILNIPVDIEFWNIFRRKDGILQQVGKFPVATTAIYDYVVGNDITYDYLIFPETADLAGSPISSNEVTTRWWNWAIMSFNDQEEGKNYSTVDEIWLLDIDLSTGDFPQNVNKSVYKGLTKFPKISTGQSNYLTGNVSALLGNVGCETLNYSDTIKMQQAFRNFINNGKKKLLKSRKGNVIICETMGNSFNIADRFEEQQTTINFNVIEIGDESNYSVISFEEEEIENIVGGEGSSLLGGDNTNIVS